MVKRAVFPWDIGIWENLVEAMGGGGWWGWWWVGARTRKVWPGEGKAGKGKAGKGKGGDWDWERDGGGGVRWEVNGFEGESSDGRFFFFFFTFFLFVSSLVFFSSVLVLPSHPIYQKRPLRVYTLLDLHCSVSSAHAAWIQVDFQEDNSYAIQRRVTAKRQLSAFQARKSQQSSAALFNENVTVMVMTSSASWRFFTMSWASFGINSQYSHIYPSLLLFQDLRG